MWWLSELGCGGLDWLRRKRSAVDCLTSEALGREFARARTLFSSAVAPTQLRWSTWELGMAGDKGVIFTEGSFWKAKFGQAKPADRCRNVDSGAPVAVARVGGQVAVEGGAAAEARRRAAAPWRRHGAGHRPNCSVRSGGLWSAPWVRRVGPSAAQTPAPGAEPV